MVRHASGLRIKKKFGQHFLRSQSVVEHMIDHVELSKDSQVIEIGCGDGFLTKAILERPLKQLWVFEIDPEWADYVRQLLPDKRLSIFLENILDVDLRARLGAQVPWTLLANLPYQITFPIFHKLYTVRDLIPSGVVMIQEEVAQKMVKAGGRGYGYSSLFFQYYYQLTLLDKVPPGAFVPPPKIYSRLIAFKAKEMVEPIIQEDNFWKFVKVLFAQPRRTIKNNITQFHYDFSAVDPQVLTLRAQQMTMAELLDLWNKII